MFDKTRFWKNYLSRHPYNFSKFGSQNFERQVRKFELVFARYLSADKHAKILEIGCGSGVFVWWLQQKGYTNVRGIDISQEQIELGRQLGVVNIEVGDLRQVLTKQEERFDLIAMHDVLEHFRKDEIMEILEQIYIALKRGGQLFLTVPNAGSLFGALHRYHDFTHEVSFDATSLCQVLLLAGFENVEIFERGPVPHGLKSFVRTVLWRGLFRPVIKFYLLVETGSVGSGVYTQVMSAVAEKPVEK